MRQRIIGATLLIAGTTIGAGMLALPMTSARLGFSKSIILLLALWVYMVLAAGIMVEISHGKGLSIAALAKKRLGPWGKHLAGVSLLVLFWSLLAAYISGGSSILHREIGGFHALITIFYVLIFGVCVAFCTKVVDYTNRLLFMIKSVVFLVMIFGLVPFIKSSYLASPGIDVAIALPQAIPVFFTSFGFHGSLPSLIQYLHGDKKSIYFSIIVGSLIPLIVYILWQAVTLGVLGLSFEVGGDVGLFISQLTTKTGKAYLSILADVFAFFAIATSFLGVALGLFDYISEWFALDGKEGKTVVGKAKIACITFALPLTFSLFYPKGFVFALGFAAIFLSLLAVVLPSIIAIKEKKGSTFILNKGILLFMLLTGLVVIGIEVFGKIV
ncbi:MAG: aromatic amino acid transport family protein [Chlamydiota bacterium]